jgi:hypothetical protein
MMVGPPVTRPADIEDMLWEFDHIPQDEMIHAMDMPVHIVTVEQFCLFT